MQELRPLTMSLYESLQPYIQDFALVLDISTVLRVLSRDGLRVTRATVTETEALTTGLGRQTVEVEVHAPQARLDEKLAFLATRGVVVQGASVTPVEDDFVFVGRVLLWDSSPGQPTLSSLWHLEEGEAMAPSSLSDIPRNPFAFGPTRDARPE